jgi:hypothetical protein
MDLNVPRLHGPNDDYKADTCFIGARTKNMNRKDLASLRFGVVFELCVTPAGSMA